MGGRGPVAGRFFGIALAGILTVASTVMARADGCDASDFGQAFVDSVSNIPLGCASDFTDGDFWYLVMAIQIASNISSTSGTDDVQQACNDVANVIQQVSSVGGDIGKAQALVNQLNKYLASNPEAQQNFQQFLNDYHIQDALNEASSDTQTLSNALDYFHCGCQVVFEKGNAELNQDVNACLSEALCDVTGWLNANVSSAFTDTCPPSPPPPPTQVACTVANPLQLGATGVGSWPGCAGNYCFDQNVANGDGGNYCYCPHAMQIVGLDSGGYPSYLACGCPNGMAQLGQFVCGCPQGTTQSGPYTCTCKNGQSILPDGNCPVVVGDVAPPQWNAVCPLNQVAIVTDVYTFSYSCSCAAGLAKVGDSCVSACADASQVMLSPGACCAASQVTSCGTCCPQGKVPSGNACVSPVKFTPVLTPTLKPSPNSLLKPSLPQPKIKP